MISATGDANSSGDLGSGIIVGSEGNTLYILTAKHVLSQNSANITFINNQTSSASVINSVGGELDVAVLSCSKPSRYSLNASFKRSTEIPPEGSGGLVVIGHPLGRQWFVSYDHVFTQDAPKFRDHQFTITPKAIGQGNSGGPVLNRNKELLGMVIKVDKYEAVAIKIEKVWSILQRWGIPTNLLNWQSSQAGNTKRNQDRKPPTYVDPIAGEFVLVEGGSFQMGSKDGDSDEQPVHPVTVKDYYIGKFEVSQAIWKKVMGENPSSFQDCAQCPVESVSWNDIQDFIRKLNQQSSYTYRLPTEAEWEYAAGGGENNRTKFSGTNNETQLYRYGNFCDDNCNYSWKTSTQDDRFKQTAPVGTYLPNPLGLHDMSGNVWEWCEDWYHDSYKGAPADGSAWLDPKGSDRVVRGGSWFRPTSPPSGCAIATQHQS